LFGKLAGKEFVIEKEKLDIIKKHMADNFYPYEPNDMMIDRLQKCLDKNKKISGADAIFYFHELREAELMQKGYLYEDAHNQALQDYKVSAFSVYHPDVIAACRDDFNQKWRDFWGII